MAEGKASEQNIQLILKVRITLFFIALEITLFGRASSGQPGFVSSRNLVAIVNLSIEVACFNLKFMVVSTLSTLTLNVRGERLMLSSELLKWGEGEFLWIKLLAHFCFLLSTWRLFRWVHAQCLSQLIVIIILPMWHVQVRMQ
jgi:hypothetical protein